jgi:hypothetical protein
VAIVVGRSRYRGKIGTILEIAAGGDSALLLFVDHERVQFASIPCAWFLAIDQLSVVLTSPAVLDDTLATPVRDVVRETIRDAAAAAA